MTYFFGLASVLEIGSSFFYCFSSPVIQPPELISGGNHRQFELLLQVLQEQRNDTSSDLTVYAVDVLKFNFLKTDFDI